MTLTCQKKNQKAECLFIIIVVVVRITGGAVIQIGRHTTARIQ